MVGRGKGGGSPHNYALKKQWARDGGGWGVGAWGREREIDVGSALVVNIGQINLERN
jgi:hypothetical protein